MSIVKHIEKTTGEVDRERAASDEHPLPTVGSSTPYKLISAATTNATLLKNSPGKIVSMQVFNVNAAARYLKLYNKATAPTVGTDLPVKTIVIPGNTAGAGAAFVCNSNFSTGISFAITAGITDADVAAVGANEVVVNIDYL